MLPQLTVYAKILCLLMVVMIAGATPEYMYLQSANSLKFVRIVAKNGTVFADDNGQNRSPQNFTIESFMIPNMNYTVGIAIRGEETNMYLCFDKHWRIKGMKIKANIVNRPRCLFSESLEGGSFQFKSVIDQTKYLGFFGNGKPVNYRGNRSINTKCFNFYRTNASAHRNYYSTSTSTTSAPHPHRHRHGMGDHQKRTRNKPNSHRSQNLADQYSTPSQLSPSKNNNNNSNHSNSGRLTRLMIPSSGPSYRTTQMSNDVLSTTQKPVKAASTKKQVKPSKRHGKANNKKLANSGVSSNIRHHRHQGNASSNNNNDNRNSKLGFVRTTPTAFSF